MYAIKVNCWFISSYFGASEMDEIRLRGGNKSCHWNDGGKESAQFVPSCRPSCLIHLYIYGMREYSMTAKSKYEKEI